MIDLLMQQLEAHNAPAAAPSAQPSAPDSGQQQRLSQQFLRSRSSVGSSFMQSQLSSMLATRASGLSDDHLNNCLANIASAAQQTDAETQTRAQNSLAQARSMITAGSAARQQTGQALDKTNQSLNNPANAELTQIAQILDTFSQIIGALAQLFNASASPAQPPAPNAPTNSPATPAPAAAPPTAPAAQPAPKPAAQPAPKPAAQPAPKPAAQPTPKPETTSSPAKPVAATFTGILQMGSRGPEVARMQQELASKGFDPGGVDGIFGARTQAALKAFQQSRGLQVDGVFGPQSAAALYGAPSPAPAPRPAPSAPPASDPVNALPAGILQLGSRGAGVRTLQAALAEKGFDPGGIDGIFGAQTEAALRSFQSSRGIDADGIYGPQTRAAFSRGPASNPPPVNNGPIGNLPRTGNAFIDSISAAAVQSQHETGVPAAVTIAQAILESGWGQSGLTREANNYFGIKGDGPAGHVTVPTQEYINGHYVTIDADFRKYHNAAESFEDHGRFFLENSRYAPALAVKNDPYAFARAIAAAGYATAPNYADTLISLINQYGLARFDGV
jgi:peptidoglycan hydrolase-like protein with peptidoglycan-binding domain/ElaB/YqjD/DUF883 family membrane-anchored ribosome-binding protein